MFVCLDVLTTVLNSGNSMTWVISCCYIMHSCLQIYKVTQSVHSDRESSLLFNHWKQEMIWEKLFEKISVFDFRKLALVCRMKSYGAWYAFNTNAEMDWYHDWCHSNWRGQTLMAWLLHGREVYRISLKVLVAIVTVLYTYFISAMVWNTYMYHASEIFILHTSVNFEKSDANFLKQTLFLKSLNLCLKSPWSYMYLGIHRAFSVHILTNTNNAPPKVGAVEFVYVVPRNFFTCHLILWLFCDKKHRTDWHNCFSVCGDNEFK